MIPYHVQRRRGLASVALMVAMLVGASLVGCSSGSGSDSMTVPQNVATASIPPVSPTSTLNSKQLYALHIQETRIAVRTRVALTAEPTWTPGGAPPYTGPTMTPRLGMLPSCANTNSLDPYMVSCWVGVYNGDIVNVFSGREGRAGDITQGVVWIFNRNTEESQLIPTPDKAGPVSIVSVDGTRFTLVAAEHTPPITYIFDLATRQWVNP